MSNLAKKYILGDKHPTKNLFRIVALIDIPAFFIKAGDVGGWVSGYQNLSQADICWIKGDFEVSEQARVSDRAIIFGNGIITGNCQVKDNAEILGSPTIDGSVVIGGSARIDDNPTILGTCIIRGSSVFCGEAFIDCPICFEGDTRIEGTTRLIADNDRRWKPVNKNINHELSDKQKTDEWLKKLMGLNCEPPTTLQNEKDVWEVDGHVAYDDAVSALDRVREHIESGVKYKFIQDAKEQEDTDKVTEKARDSRRLLKQIFDYETATRYSKAYYNKKKESESQKSILSPVKKHE